MSKTSDQSTTFFRYFPSSERDRKWGLYATTAGHTTVAPGGGPYPPVAHPRGYDFHWSQGRILHEYQVLYISKGSGCFESRFSGCLKVRAGTVFILFPGAWHRYRPNPETGWTDHWIGFDGSIPRNWVRNGFFSRRSPLIHPVPDASLATQFTLIIEAIRINPPALQQVLAGSITVLCSLLYSARQARLTGQENSNSAIQQAVERMQKASAEPLHFEALARELGVSYSWFRRTFVEHTGFSPHQYLLELRLAHARSLLAQTRLPVKQVAWDVGFENEHYFCRLFQRRHHATPSEWRREEAVE